MDKWDKKKHGVDPKAAEAAARGATAAPDYAVKIWQTLKSKISPEAKADKDRNKGNDKRNPW
jgi:hypothetical protein